MRSEHAETFEQTAQKAGTVHTTTAVDFPETLSTAIEMPAIGTPLPFEDVSLDETPVETAFSPRDLEQATTGVTHAAFGIGDYGSVSLPSTPEGVELVSLYTPTHVAVLAASDIEPDMKAAYERVSNSVANGEDTQVLATGPSATADMGTLVQGVHGPHEVHTIILEDR